MNACQKQFMQLYLLFKAINRQIELHCTVKERNAPNSIKKLATFEQDKWVASLPVSWSLTPLNVIASTSYGGYQ